jgi:hypothetical protein
MTIRGYTPRVYITLLTAGVAVAALTATTAPARVRHALEFTFSGIRPSVSSAWSIFAANARLACLPLGFALVLVITGRGTGRTGYVIKASRLAMDAIVGIGASLNIALVGASVGAYGERMLKALLPHGPIEVLGFAVALSAYISARRGALLSWRSLGGTALTCTVTLAVSAMLESYVQL